MARSDEQKNAHQNQYRRPPLREQDAQLRSRNIAQIDPEEDCSQHDQNQCAEVTAHSEYSLKRRPLATVARIIARVGRLVQEMGE